eukprot:gene4734-gene6556
MGTICVTPSPDSTPIPVVRPEAYKERTLCGAIQIAGIEQRIGEKYRMVFCCNMEFIVESIIPELLHTIPICYYPTLNR